MAYSRWRDTRCEADTSKLVHVRRSRALSFGGVLNLKSSWKLASSTMRGLEESGGPERAGSRLKKNGTTEFPDRIKANLSLRQETKIPHGNHDL